MKPRFGFSFFFLLASSLFIAESKCTNGCGLALASYYIWEGSTLTSIAQIMESRVLSNSDEILSFNKDTVPNDGYIKSRTRINIPIPCDCIEGEFLGHMFQYSLYSGDDYTSIAMVEYSNLTTEESLRSFNSYGPTNIPDSGKINVTVNCYCGNSEVSMEYGLFITYPLRPEDTLQSIANETKLDAELLQRYNPGVNFSRGRGLVYIPGKDQNGSFVPLYPSVGEAGLRGGVIAGLSIGVGAGLLPLTVCSYVGYYRRRRLREEKLHSEDFELHSAEVGPGGPAPSVIAGLTDITVDKSIEFAYEELANATNNFSMAYKIGQGGFGSVYYAELRGERAAIKKMDMKASREFCAELKVLTHVHHLNLVRLIGYCVKGALLLVYEYIENGNLSQHLHDPGREPIPWSIRLQIALDSARGLEYIHEHTVPVYVHRDIKSANILIDKNFHGKVADFGLIKLVKAESSPHPTEKLRGTFGYMPPEFGEGIVSTKSGVYSFGVLLFELISAKEAIFMIGESNSETVTLRNLFHEVLNSSEPRRDLRKLVDPRLGDDYPIDSVYKMAQLAKVCTQEDQHLRPSMKSVVVDLMTLSSTIEDWDVSYFCEN